MYSTNGIPSSQTKDNSEETFKIRDSREKGYYRIDSVFVSGGYSKVLGPYGIAVYNILAFYANNETQEAWPSHNKIAALIGCSRSQVQRMITHLEKLNMIQVKRGRFNDRGEPTSNLIVLLNRSEWTNPEPRQKTKVRGMVHQTIPIVSQTIPMVHQTPKLSLTELTKNEITSSSSCAPESPEPNAVEQPDDDEDEDVIFSDIHEGLTVMGLEDKASRVSLIARCEIKKPDELKLLVGQWLKWKAGGGKKPDDWHKGIESYIYTKIRGGERPPAVKGNLEIPDIESGPGFIQEGDYVEVSPEPEPTGQTTVDPEWFHEAMLAAKAGAVIPAYPGSYNPEDGSYNL